MGKLALLAAAVLAGLLVLEAAVRLLELPIGARTQPVSPLGPRYLPNSPFQLADENPIGGRMNNVGFHDRPFAFDLPSTTRRIGFFGDSFTEARQVEEDSTFVSRFEDGARAAGLDVEASAFGLIGSGADQSFFRCLRILEQARFDEAVYVFCQNDFHDGFQRERKPASWPFLSIPDEARGGATPAHWTGFFQCDRGEPSLAATLKPLLKESHLLGFVSNRLGTRSTRRAFERGFQSVAPESVYALFDLGEAAPEPERLAMERWKRVVHEWKSACDTRGVTFRVLYIPSAHEVDDSTHAAAYRWGTPRWGLSEWIGAACLEKGIPFIDPRERFLAVSGRQGRSLYWNHLNYAGHRAVADTLVAYWAAAASP